MRIPFAASVALLILATAGLLFAWATWETRTQRRELEATLRAEGGALVEALGHALGNALSTSLEVEEMSTTRLLDIARLVALLDAGKPLDAARLRTLRDDFGLHRVALLDRDLTVIAEAASPGSPAEPGIGHGRGEALRELAAGAADEAVFPADPNPPPGESRYAAAVRLSRPAVIVVETGAAEALSFLESIDMNRLMEAVAASGGIQYALLEDEQGRPIASAGNLAPSGSTAPLVFEHPVELARGNPGRLRLAISGEPLAAANRAARRRIALAGTVALGISVALAALALARRRAAALRHEISDVRSMTEAILDGMEEAVLVVGHDGILRHANPAAGRLFGRVPSAMIGRPCVETPCALAGALIEEGSGPREITLEPAAGAPRLVLVSASSVRDRRGASVGTAILMRDVTGLRRLEREARRSEELAAFSRLASVVAHEVRNPLNAISMAVQRWWAEFPPASPGEDHARIVGLLRQEIQRLDGIVGDFLELARPPKVNPVAGDLGACVRGLVPLLREGAPGGVRLLIEAAELPPVRFDPAALRQVLHNLVRNAIDAVGDEGTIQIVMSLRDGRALLEVSDDGKGIRAEDLERVFEFGFTTRPAGSGMGLPIVHRLVTEMAGTIAIQSPPAGGTRVAVTFPLASAAAGQGS